VGERRFGLRGARLRDLRDAEVEHLDRGRPVGAVGEKEIRGLEVAMNDAERVRLGERLARLEHELERLVDGERAALRERVREVEPLEVLHHDVRRTVGQRPHVAHLRDVLALDARCGARFAHEARGRFLLLGGLAR
jgi:hypothetical protein